MPMTKPAAVPATICGASASSATDAGPCCVCPSTSATAMHKQQHGNDAIKRLRCEPGCQPRPEPRPKQTAGEQVDDDRPMRRDGRKGNRRPAERQSRSYDHKAHRFVEDHRLERREPKRADQQRQPKFRAAQTDQPAERADHSTAAEGCRRAASCNRCLSNQPRRGFSIAHGSAALWQIGYSAP